MTEHADLRSLEVINFDNYAHLPIHIIGMGATGSRVFEQLVCMGARSIHCYDFDEIEAHNLHNQLWNAGDVGQLKVTGARFWLAGKYNMPMELGIAEPSHRSDPPDHCTLEAAPNIHFHNERVTAESAEQMEGIVFLLTDTFDSRREIMSGAVKGGVCPLVIETRLGTRFNEVRVVDPLDKKQVSGFMKSLGDDDAPDAEVSACGTKINCALSAIGAANIACWTLVNVLTEQIGQQRINNNYQPIIQQASQDL